MTEEEELARWRTEWATLGGRDDLAGALAARVARDARRIRLGIAGEVAAALFSSSLSLWMAITTHGRPALVSLAAGISLFNGVWLTRLFTLREGAVVATGLDGFVALTRKRLADDLRWNTFSRKSTLVVALAAAGWAAWIMVGAWELYRREPWRAYAGVGGLVVLVGAVFAWLHVRRRRIVALRERFERLVAESLVEE